MGNKDVLSKNRALYEGRVFTSKKYGDFQVVEYNGNKNVRIRFVNTGYENVVPLMVVKTGNVADKSILDLYQKHKNLRYLWETMRNRCNLPSVNSYKYYGGRGVTYTRDWDCFKCFSDWALSKGYKNGLSIERIDVNGNYHPDNCIFIPKCEQSRNTRKTSKYGFGVTKKRQSYQVRVQIDGVAYSVGCFKTPELARQARDKFLERR